MMKMKMKMKKMKMETRERNVGNIRKEFGRGSNY